MATSNRQKSSDIPADLQPYYNERPGNSLARWITRILAIIILIAAAVLFIRWVWHQTHTSDNKPASSTSQSATSGNGNGPSTQKAPASSSNSGSTTSGGSSSGQQTATTSGGQSGTSGNTNSRSAYSTNSTGSSSQSAKATGNLSNTGPGQTIGVFVASSLLFAVLYELRLRKERA